MCTVNLSKEIIWFESSWQNQNSKINSNLNWISHMSDSNQNHYVKKTSDLNRFGIGKIWIMPWFKSCITLIWITFLIFDFFKRKMKFMIESKARMIGIMHSFFLDPSFWIIDLNHFAMTWDTRFWLMHAKTI